jgi:RNA polymerase sigma factor (sigma-70 family)
MEAGRLSQVLQHIRHAALGDGGDMTDGQLLECFLESGEQAAFQGLVRRHGRMVLGVCQRILKNAADAEDAFQATFLVLVRKAGGLLPRQTVGDWLYGVAYNTALKARAAALRRRTVEMRVGAMATDEPRTEDLWRDLQPILDRELQRLPEKYRRPIILCDLEGKTRKEAAQLLGWPEGTVHVRLARGRVLLAQRLTRHGVTLSGGTLALLLSQQTASAALPAHLVVGTAQAASLIVGGQVLAGGAVSASVASLTDGVLKSMALAKVKMAAAVVLAVGVLGSGMGTAAWQLLPTGAQSQSHAVSSPKDKTATNDRPTSPATAEATPKSDRAPEEPPALAGKVPDAVEKAVRARFPRAKLIDGGTDNEKGLAGYTVRIEYQGRQIDVALTMDAVITAFEKKIEAKDLPAAVVQTLESRFPKATFIKIEEVFKVESQAETLECYDVLLVPAQKKKSLTVGVTPDGRIVKQER